MISTVFRFTSIKQSLIWIFMVMMCNSYSQDTIYLTTNRQGKFTQYKFKNKKDKSLITIGYNNGLPDSPFFKLKSKIPTNKYYIYINDSLALKAKVENNQRQGIWVWYTQGKTQKEQHFKKDTLWEERSFHPNGLLKSNYKFYPIQIGVNLKTFYPSGSIKQSSKTNGGNDYIRHHYAENGDLKSREIINDGRVSVHHAFNIEGQLSQIKILTPKVEKSLITTNLTDSDSIVSYQFKNGVFDLDYKNGSLKKWNFISKNQKFQVSEHLHEHSKHNFNQELSQARIVIEADINFDGFMDKIIFPKQTSGANQPFNVFLFNSKLNFYQYSKVLSGSSLSDYGPVLDPKKKTATYTGSSGGGMYTKQIMHFNAFGKLKCSDIYWNEDLDEYSEANGTNYGTFSFNYKRIQDQCIIDRHTFETKLPLNGNESKYIPFLNWMSIQINLNNR